MRIFLLFFLFVFYNSFSQSRVGEWNIHLNYTEGTCLFSKQNTIYTGTKSQFFTYNQSDNSIESFSKLNGLNDNSVTAINSDPDSNILIIGYENGNLDLMSGAQIINIPYIKNANNIVGSKKINNIHVNEGIAYLSCSFGLVTVNINNAEILDTYYFWNNGSYGAVFDSFVFDYSVEHPYLSGKIFVATDFGLFSASKNNPNLLDPNSWITEYPILNNLGKITPSSFTNGVKKLLGQNEKNGELILFPNNYNETNATTGSCEILIFSKQKNLFVAQEIPEICNANENIVSGHIKNSALMGFSYSKLFYIDNLDDVTEKNSTSINIDMFSISPLNSLNGFNNLMFNKNEKGDVIKIYFSDAVRGLTQCVIYQGDFYFENTFIPNGPSANTFGDMSFVGDKLIIAHGGKNNSWNNLNIIKELSIYSNNTWEQTSSLKDLEVNDLLTISGAENQFFVGSWNGGLLEFSDKSLIKIYNENNSSLQAITNDGWIRIGGCCLDANNDLWVTNSQAESPISFFKNQVWESFTLSSISTNTMVGKILCTTNDQKWIQSRGEGIIVLSNSKNNEILNEKKINSSPSYGNLPSNTVNAFVEDLDGSIWVGTSNGVGVFYFPNNIFSSSNFDCETPLVEVDGYVERLLYNTNVLDIKIDGGNRKWFATEGKGVFLISENGTEEIYHFTSENSPLLSNTVYNIEINQKSGDVFFGTELGLCSFRSMATEAQENFKNVLVFPNPVKKNYSGLISISGLTDNTNVKITDISGNLVFETYSEGGFASWDGKNFSGKKVKTGVYLFFCTNNDFSETIVKKLLIYN